MSDILCAKCSEPYDSYHVYHDMDVREKTRFLNGDGCESCNFGQNCDQCSGTGKEPQTNNRYSMYCDSCKGSRYLIVRRLLTWPTERVEYGYIPNVKSLTLTEEHKILREYPQELAREGWYKQYMILCPDCTDWLDCAFCNGTGDFIPYKDPEDSRFEAMVSEVESSDEDPHEILERRYPILSKYL